MKKQRDSSKKMTVGDVVFKWFLVLLLMCCFFATCYVFAMGLRQAMGI